MSTLYKTTLIAGCIILNICWMQAQNNETKLDQLKLIKQFAGHWKCELSKDTIVVGENVAFGPGLICNSQIIVNGKIINSIKQLYGYDKKTDKFIVAELIESSPVIEICSTWFTTENTGELIVTNPDNAPFRFKFEFKSPDMIVQTAIQNDKVVKEITIKRIRDNK